MTEPEPIPMLLYCPCCNKRHLDVGPFATKPHTTHSCQNCGLTWKPAQVPTVGVEFLPGYKNADDPKDEVETLRQLLARHPCTCPASGRTCPQHGDSDPKRCV